jgi:hypothetical protein
LFVLASFFFPTWLTLVLRTFDVSAVEATEAAQLSTLTADPGSSHDADTAKEAAADPGARPWSAEPRGKYTFVDTPSLKPEPVPALAAEAAAAPLSFSLSPAFLGTFKAGGPFSLFVFLFPGFAAMIGRLKDVFHKDKVPERIIR